MGKRERRVSRTRVAGRLAVGGALVAAFSGLTTQAQADCVGDGTVVTCTTRRGRLAARLRRYHAVARQAFAGAARRSTPRGVATFKLGF